MQAYSRINSILLRRDTTYPQFQREMLLLRIEKETYLNLFLTGVALRYSNAPDFGCYLHLLVGFKEITGKKSADPNYVGYKDRIPVLMHLCAHASPENLRIFLGVKGVNLLVRDPQGRTCLFYAIGHNNEGHSCGIVSLLLDTEPGLIDLSDEMGTSPMMAAAEGRRYSLVEILLRRGADANLQRRDTEETAAHCLLKNYKENREQTLRLLVMLKDKANFHLGGWKTGTVLQAGLSMGVDLSECLLEDCEEDKESLTTLNQYTKMGDNASELEDIQSNICLGKINFSEADLELPGEEFGEDQLRSQGGGHGANEEEGCRSSLSQYSRSQEQEASAQIDFNLLSQEILEFSLSCQQRQRIVWISLTPFLTALQKLANKHGLILQIVGSFATGLWSTFSDIDINLIPADGEYRPFQAILQRIFKSLHRRKHELGITELLFVRGKVNSIKMGLCERLGSLVVDVAVFHRNNQNRAYVTYILQTLTAYPQVKPLFLVLKKLCETFDLHDHLFGGLKTYTLFLMIRSIVQNLPSQSAGELLLQVALYYGFYYEYEYDLGSLSKGKDQQQGSNQEGPRAIFNFIDPLNPKNNVGGKSTRVQEMVGMFRGVYLGLRQMREQPYLHQLFQMHAIF